MPVVFHLLYEDEANAQQNPNATLLQSRLTALNQFYDGSLYPGVGSTPTKVKFMLATHDPSGKEMAQAGINRVHYSGASDLDPSWFLNRNGSGAALPMRDRAINWDQNKYINIWIFGFKSDPQGGGETTGISPLPYCLLNSQLDGLALDEMGYYLTHLPTTYMHGIVLNNKYFSTTEGLSTLFHEMGHYLGLLHAFLEQGSDFPVCAPGMTNASDDYCADTPVYSRLAYESYIATLGNTLTPEHLIRTACNGDTFVSTNIMDYYYGTRRDLTPDQRGRVHHVYDNSPLIPRSTKGSKAILDNYTGQLGDRAPMPIFLECVTGL